MPPHVKSSNSTNLEKNEYNPDRPASTYPGIWKYPTNREVDYRMAEDWMDCKINIKINNMFKNLKKTFFKNFFSKTERR